MEKVILLEDYRNIPFEYLAPNHRDEIIMSGAKAVSAIDRIWHKNLLFRSPAEVERWLMGAAQRVHQGVLDRNANGARNNPVYNVHWLRLPPRNQLNDLEVVKIAFEARLKADPDSLDSNLIVMIREGFIGLRKKIKNGSVKPMSNSCSGLF
ncbi:MAG: hypothetical protein A4S09_05540 [Proteobacteria bacterium SG_bin7]|nr:MAG: hypothetical protein A4S09_05540 [Proteobacteria bacterium SG_bin7]